MQGKRLTQLPRSEFGFLLEQYQSSTEMIDICAAGKLLDTHHRHQLFLIRKVFLYNKDWDNVAMVDELLIGYRPKIKRNVLHVGNDFSAISRYLQGRNHKTEAD